MEFILDLTKLILGILAAVSFFAAIVIGAFASRLESPFTHMWARLLGKPLVGKKPAKQPMIIWAGFFVFLCIGASSAALIEILAPSPDVTPAPLVLGPENEDLIIAARSVQACMDAHHLSKQKEITIITEVPFEEQKQRPGGLMQTRKIAYCQWPPSSYSDSDGYVEIITDAVYGPGISEASGASYADRVYSKCDRLKLSYFWGKQFTTNHVSFEVDAYSIVTVGGEEWDPKSMGENPSDYYYKGLPVLGFYTEDKEVVVVHYAAYELEDASCIP